MNNIENDYRKRKTENADRTLTVTKENWGSLAYRLLDAERLIGPIESWKTPSSAHALLLMKRGEGELAVNGRRHLLSESGMYYVPAHAESSLLFASDKEAECYRITFLAIELGRSGAGEEESGRRLPVEWKSVSIQPWLEDIEEITSRLAEAGLGTLRADIRFQELLLGSFQQLRESQEQTTQEAGLQAAADYMERYYGSPIRREQLAELANMSGDYFTRTFKRQYGQAPLEYLTAIRIKHAKQALLQSNDSHRAIAQHVGLGDEFYFSRKFKAVTGYSPSSFVKRLREGSKIATLQHHLTGHLLALGLKPYAAVLNGYYPLGEERDGILPIGTCRVDLDKLAAAQPDLILHHDICDGETSRKIRMFEYIAPTVAIPFYDDWRIQLRKVAQVVGREREAEQWLESYEEKVWRARQQITLSTRERLLIVGVGNQCLCLFGCRNLGAVLYGDLGFEMPGSIAGIEDYRAVSQDELFLQDTDRILLTSFRNDGNAQTLRGIEATLRRLNGDPRWHELRAVKEGKVHSLFERQHLYTLYTSYSHNMLLDRLPRLFMTEKSK
jgi:ABC-type Fe3+-hydroxamate transport system substrate-binding protein